ncbi:MAG: SMP-30/gluconolactonase/LRE family protein [Deinococcus sp.]|nr:SMP-30/gluconolactonase/LRE family protein [Deinococcus sp.]
MSRAQAKVVGRAPSLGRAKLSGLEIYAEGLDHPECVAWGPDGALYAGGELGQIYRIDPQTRRPEEIARTGGFVLGIAFNKKGDLFICDFKLPAVMRLDRQGRLECFCEAVNDEQIKVPNFASFHPDGSLFVSDSGQWKTASTGRVFRLTPDGRGSLFIDGLAFANGLAVDPTGKYLYIVQSTARNVLEVAINPDGTAGRRRVYASNLQVVPDGLAFDQAGNLYCSCYAPSVVYKISPRRQVTVAYYDPENTLLAATTNLAFGGADWRDVFIANLGRWHITHFRSQVPGVPLPL